MATYEVPASKASIKQNRFEFKMPDGKKYSVPKLEYIKPSLAMQMETLDVAIGPDGRPVGDVKGSMELIRLLFTTYFPGVDLFDQFDDADQFGDWLSAWAASSEISLGESEASPAS